MTRDIRGSQPISGEKSPRAGAIVSAVVGVHLIGTALILCGCTMQGGAPPNVYLSTGVGSVQLNSPAPVAPGGDQVPPPPGLMATPPGSAPGVPVPAPGVGRDGTYSGNAELLSTAGGMCTSGMRVDNFKVRGNSVRFGQFHGTIAPDGGLQMVSDQTWIFGQFEGATFRGQVNGAGNWGAPGCTFMLTLERTGP
jgi:hypothetical protein